MSKVTNHENMRRYVHMKLSNQGEGGNTPSGDITIDDVVKFIHDAIETIAPGEFPYTTWNDIPDYLNVNTSGFCKANSIDDQMSVSTIVLNIPNYAIFQKGFTPVG